jgi:hypothetical protein
MNRVRKKPCKFCSKPIKENRRIFCSTKCYTDSGRRRAAASVNGKKWSVMYWKRFSIKFEEKYGHLDRVDQIRLAVIIGMKRAYRRKYADSRDFQKV